MASPSSFAASFVPRTCRSNVAAPPRLQTRRVSECRHRRRRPELEVASTSLSVSVTMRCRKRLSSITGVPMDLSKTTSGYPYNLTVQPDHRPPPPPPAGAPCCTWGSSPMLNAMKSMATTIPSQYFCRKVFSGGGFTSCPVWSTTTGAARGGLLLAGEGLRALPLCNVCRPHNDLDCRPTARIVTFVVLCVRETFARNGR